MDTTTSAVLTGVVVITGEWAEGKKITARTVMGAGFLAIFLATISAINDDLARGFAVLILVTALMMYGLPIARKAGFSK